MTNMTTFNFQIINFPHLSGNYNIHISPAYGVYISQLIRYARACSSYPEFVKRHGCLIKKLMSQGFQKQRLILFSEKNSSVDTKISKTNIQFQSHKSYRMVLRFWLHHDYWILLTFQLFLFVAPLVFVYTELQTIVIQVGGLTRRKT